MESHVILQSLAELASESAEISAIGIARFAGVFFPVAPSIEVSIAVPEARRNDTAWQYRLVSSLPDLAVCHYIAPDRIVCQYGQPSIYLAVRFVDPKDFANTRFSLSLGPQLVGVRTDRSPFPQANVRSSHGSNYIPEAEVGAIAIACRTAIAKLKRGELFQAINKLTVLRSMLTSLLGSGFQRSGRPCLPVLEEKYPQWIESFRRTVPEAYSPAAISSAFVSLLALYKTLAEANERVGQSDGYRDLVITRLSRHLNNSGSEGEVPTTKQKSAILRDFEHVFERLKWNAVQDDNILGIAIGGSWLGGRETGESGPFDGNSDLDIYVITECRVKAVWSRQFVNQVGDVYALHQLRSDYVMALFGALLDKIDFRFVTLESLQRRWETPQIIWERSGRVSSLFEKSVEASRFNDAVQPSIYWVDSMFSPALTGAGSKMREGRLLQATADVNSIRVFILGPLLALRANVPSRGVRRVEFRFPEHVERLGRTVGACEGNSCQTTLSATVDFFESVRAAILQPPAKLAKYVASD